MIQGAVDADRKAVVQLQLRAADRRIIDIDVVIDTGFTGYLTLPAAKIAELGLVFYEASTFIMGDNSEVEFCVFTGAVALRGQDKPIYAIESESEPLLGMSLMEGFRLLIDVVELGPVILDDIP